MNTSNLKLSHSSLANGYIKVNEVIEENYKGKFGEGIKVHSHLKGSSKYHTVTYYIKK